MPQLPPSTAPGPNGAPQPVSERLTSDVLSAMASSLVQSLNDAERVLLPVVLGTTSPRPFELRTSKLGRHDVENLLSNALNIPHKISAGMNRAIAEIVRALAAGNDAERASDAIATLCTAAMTLGKKIDAAIAASPLKGPRVGTNAHFLREGDVILPLSEDKDVTLPVIFVRRDVLGEKKGDLHGFDRARAIGVLGMGPLDDGDSTASRRRARETISTIGDELVSFLDRIQVSGTDATVAPNSEIWRTVAALVEAFRESSKGRAKPGLKFHGEATALFQLMCQEAGLRSRLVFGVEVHGAVRQPTCWVDVDASGSDFLPFAPQATLTVGPFLLAKRASLDVPISPGVLPRRLTEEDRLAQQLRSTDAARIVLPDGRELVLREDPKDGAAVILNRVGRMFPFSFEQDMVELCSGIDARTAPNPLETQMLGAHTVQIADLTRVIADGRAALAASGLSAPSNEAQTQVIRPLRVVSREEAHVYPFDDGGTSSVLIDRETFRVTPLVNGLTQSGRVELSREEREQLDLPELGSMPARPPIVVSPALAIDSHPIPHVVSPPHVEAPAIELEELPLLPHAGPARFSCGVPGGRIKPGAFDAPVVDPRSLIDEVRDELENAASAFNPDDTRPATRKRPI